MMDSKTAIEIGRRFILPTLLALIIFGVPLGYQYFQVKKERSLLADLQVSLEKKKAELEANSASQEAEFEKKAKKLGEKEAELSSRESQLKKSQASLDQREQEYQTALAKLRHEQALARQKPKRVTLKRDEMVYARKRPSRDAKKIRPAKASPPPVAIPPVVRFEERLPQARPPGACGPIDGGADATREMARLKRKISATSFKVSYRPADLIPNIRSGLPEDLLRRLGESDEFLPSNASLGIGYPPLKAQHDSPSSTDAVRDVAHKTRSQFVLSGVVEAGIGRNDNGRWIELMEVEVGAYDGLSGVLVAKRRQGMEIANENEIETGSVFGSAQYFNTPFGKRFDALMKSLVEGIRTDLVCMPFMAKITAIEIDNNKIYLDAGVASRVAPGDKFVVYHSAKRTQPESASSGVLGAQPTPVASLTIRQVFPLFSIGELSVEPKKTGLLVGDFVSAQKTYLERQ